MNIHPLFVHFPIALLVVYSLLEAAPGLRRTAWAATAKEFILFAGCIGAFFALLTGGMAEDLIRATNPRAYILEVHSLAAGITTVVYLLLAAAYLVRIFDYRGWGDRITGRSRFLRAIWNFKKRVARLIRDTWVAPALALLGLAGMIITGALGAAIVYGPEIDPVVSFIYRLFWAQ
ncbi:hypothetical protein KGM48_01495 [Patescibacteria group bacterium]|nr:hypothetical protein [Patescibacteria group bacterium]